MDGLYIHIPFCIRKCNYCDFFSVPARSDALLAYVALLKKHLSWAVEQGWQGPVNTIYFGGGTPSLLPPQCIDTLVCAIDRQLGIAPEAEITLEANPETVTKASLCGYQKSGVNRISIGLQTLNSEQLACLGRPHTVQDGLNAVAWARRAGFSNLSVDLMFALPGQTLPALDRDLEQYLQLAPEHLSCYGLTADVGTSLGKKVDKGQVILPSDECYAEYYMSIHDLLTAHGYQHYEIANYARKSHVCRHNMGYWQRRSYLGLGAGAHSFENRLGGCRWAVPNNLDHYRMALETGQEPAVCLESFTLREALIETIYLGLRTAEGVSDRELDVKFGTDLASAFPVAVQSLLPWLTKEGDRWYLTPRGWLLYDRLIQAFF
ncbi:MAG: radical SAM family heme chaperone HemW [Deltaproteobacteria bacterium]|jgi:oxygen-independent coproporphyrinogen-3 oxidase|nr:radical SAM family heme chaperone HemW [Deltaproteobacteria bacterium]